MGYRLRPKGSIASEVKRIADKQLALAVVELGTAGPHRDEAIHAVRRHVKKIRALMRLVRPALGDAYQASNRRLRHANRMLAPIADGHAVVDTIARVRRRYRPHPKALATVRAALLERAARIDRQIPAARRLSRLEATLAIERARVGGWMLNASGFGALAPGLERSMRRARRAMRRAAARPTGERYHAWRQRVKDLWFHTRLLEARTGGHLKGLARHLEVLDGCLGEYHNVVVLEHVLTTEAPVARREAAASLLLLRRHQRQLRREAVGLGGRVLREKPRAFVRRVRRLWRAEARRQTPAARRGPWRRAA